MFDNYIFRSWPLILAGAALMATLFMVAALLGQLVSTGTMRFSTPVAAVGLGAFGGYIGVTWILRQE